MPRVVHRLIGHARTHRAIANNRDAVADPVFRRAAQIARHGKAQSRRNRGRTMRRAKRIIWAFRPLGETRQPALLPQGPDPVAPPSQDLVRIGLMADIPDDPVFRRIEHRVQSHRQFDNPQPGPQMATGFRNRADRLGPQLVGQPPQLGIAHALHVGGHMHAVQQRRFGSICHAAPLGACYISREITNRAASRKASARSP